MEKDKQQQGQENQDPKTSKGQDPKEEPFNKGKRKRHRGGRGGQGGRQGGGNAGQRPASAHNDVNWYLANPVLANAVGTFSMNDPLGTVYHDDCSVKFSRNDKSGTVVNATTNKIAVPGIAAFYFVPTIPMGPKVGADFFNQVAMKLYIYVRHQNSGHANYEYADLMQALYSVLSVNGIYGTLTRVYGSLLRYSVMNKYKAAEIVRAQGFDYADLVQRIPDLYSVIDRLRAAFDSYPIPKKLPMADRQLWMTANLFKDSDDIKSPLWMFVLSHYYPVPDIDAKQEAVALPWYKGTGTGADHLANFTDIATLVDNLIKSLLSHEDYGIMFGDILKAYGAENCAVLKQIPRDYTIAEIYDANANLQLHNASCVDFSTAALSARILQSSNTHSLDFYCNCTQQDNANMKSNLILGDTMLLSFPKHEVTPGEFLVATRLTARWEYLRPAGQTIWNLVQCGTEVLIGGDIFYFQSYDATGTIHISKQSFNSAMPIKLSTTAGDTDIAAVVDYSRFLYLYSQFDNLPRAYCTVYRIAANGDITLPTNLYGMFDLDCFVIIDKHNLDSLNYTAATSEFGYTDAAQVG